MKMEMNQEMVGDAMEGMGEDTGEADEVYERILGDIGLEMDDTGAVGTSVIASKNVVAAPKEEMKDDEMNTLESRLAALGS